MNSQKIWIRILFSVIFVSVALNNAAPISTLFIRLTKNVSVLEYAFRPEIMKSVLLMIKIAVLSLMGCIITGLPISFWILRTSLPCNAFFRTILGYGYIVPPYLYAVAWASLLAPSTGILNIILNSNLNIYSEGGLVFVLGTSYMPLFLLTLWNGFYQMDASLEEASKICGASNFRTFWSITLPCIFPSLLSASLLFLITVFSAFGVPAIIGSPGRIYLLTTKIYQVIKSGGTSGMDQAIAASIWLFLISGFLILLNEYLKNRWKVSLVTGKSPRPSKLKLGSFQMPLFLLVLCIVFVITILPLFSVVLSSFFKIPGIFKSSNFTLDNYSFVFSIPETGHAFFNSTILALLTGFICAGFGFFIAYFKTRTAFKGRNFLFQISVLPYAIPGTMLAIAFIISFGTGWGIFPIYLLGSLWLLLMAYVAKDLAIGVQSIAPALQNIDLVHDEAARVCGATTLQTIFYVLIPQLKKALFTVLVLTALPALSELTMSVLLTGPGSETLGTLIFQLQDYANPQGASALASILIGVLLIVFSMLKTFELRKS